jgi:hypothetical protein
MSYIYQSFAREIKKLKNTFQVNHSVDPGIIKLKTITKIIKQEINYFITPIPMLMRNVDISWIKVTTH